MSFQELADETTNIVLDYKNGGYKDLLQMHRVLSSNIFLLGLELIKFQDEWSNIYYNSPHKTNAAKERDADSQMPELYACKIIMENAKTVVISIGQGIKNS